MYLVQGSAGEGRLSIIVPVYQEAANLVEFHGSLLGAILDLRAAYPLTVDIVYVDDGSTDGTAELARRLELPAGRVVVASLSRNFGKEAALAAGLEVALPGAVLFMDGDGQHPTRLIAQMVSGWLDEGFDVVYAAKRDRRGESLRRRLLSWLFYAAINFGGRITVPLDGGDFRLLSPRATAALRQLPERSRFFKGLSTWVGFPQKRIDFTPDRRRHGVSKFNPSALASLAVEGMTAFSVAPLWLSTILGLGLAVIAASYGVWIILDKIVFGIPIPGYPSVVVGVMFVGAVQLLMIGVLGAYIARILVEVKQRPIFIIAETSIRDQVAEAVVTSRERPAG